jgi:hypothetical protein
MIDENQIPETNADDIPTSQAEAAPAQPTRVRTAFNALDKGIRSVAHAAVQTARFLGFPAMVAALAGTLTRLGLVKDHITSVSPNWMNVSKISGASAGAALFLQVAYLGSKNLFQRFAFNKYSNLKNQDNFDGVSLSQLQVVLEGMQADRGWGAYAKSFIHPSTWTDPVAFAAGRKAASNMAEGFEESVTCQITSKQQVLAAEKQKNTAKQSPEVSANDEVAPENTSRSPSPSIAR